jgi:integral membrane protein
MVDRILKQYEQFKPFTELEAWAIFRLAAFAEAAGWTLLISGILISKYLMPGNNIAVQLAGHTHGIFFLTYIVAVIGLYPSQSWSRRRTIIAGLASVPPYGSLIFEQWAAHQRRCLHIRRQLNLMTYNLWSQHV